MTRSAFADRNDVSSDYQELLARGYILRRYSNAFGWMAAIHATARSDSLHVQSTVSPTDPELAWTILRRASSSDPMFETAQVMLMRKIAIEVVRGPATGSTLETTDLAPRGRLNAALTARNPGLTACRV